MKRSLAHIILLLILQSSCTFQEKHQPKRVKVLPKLKINFQGEIKKDSNTNAQLTLIDKNIFKRYPVTIERRGGISMKFHKFSYEIDLKRDIPLLDLPQDDDWIINATYIDKTFLRHSLSFDLFQAMDSNNIAPKTKYLEWFQNDSYYGLMVLMEKMDKSTLGINDEDSTAFIFKEPHIFRPSYEDIYIEDSTNFHHQTYPDHKDLYDKMESIKDFILTSNEKTFNTEIKKMFDIHNIIDWHLLLLLTNNSDGILKNFYLYKKDAHTPIRVAIWDYDHSFGRDGDNELNLDTRPLDVRRSILIDRLLDQQWYKSQLLSRWKALNESGLFSPDHLQEEVQKRANKIKPFALKNFKRWPVESQFYYDKNNFDQEIEIILKYIELRHDRLEKYFNNLEL